MSFGQRFAELRRERKMSQYELADRLGFSRGQLANYEQGQREPDYDTLKKIADFFGVSTDYLLGKTDAREVKADPNAYWFRVDTEGVDEERRQRMLREIERSKDFILEKYKNNED